MMKKLRGLMNLNKKEDGAVSVIVALFLTVAIGFTALSVDGGVWRSTKRKCQNAADAAALVAADAYFNDNATDATALSLAMDAAAKNGVVVTKDEIQLVKDTVSVTAIIDKIDQRYFSKANNSDTVTVHAESTAQLSQEIIENPDNVPMNSCVEAGKNLLWSGEGKSVIKGGIQSGGALTITSAVEIEGDISADGEGKFEWQKTLDLRPNGGMTVNGNISVLGDMSVTSDITVNGNIEVKDGKVDWNTNSGKVNGKITETGSTANSWTYNGVEVTKGHESNASDVKHTNWTWKWEHLASAKDTAVEITTDLYNQYVQEECNNESWRSYMAVWNNNFTFNDKSDFNGFVAFCRRKAGVGESAPVYFPGNLTINTSVFEFDYDGAIIVEGDIQSNSKLALDAKNDGMTIMSLNGNVTLGNNGDGNVINGAVIVMNSEKHLQLNGSGNIVGGTISNGSVTMNGAWECSISENWQRHLPSSSGKVTVNKFRLVK